MNETERVQQGGRGGDGGLGEGAPGVLAMGGADPAGVVRVLGFAGSLRSGSYNRALLEAAVEEAPGGVEVELFDLRDIPLYDYDVEAQGDPEPVRAFKDAIRRSDALLIATPEYQHGLPGVLKNALDWASRPPGRSVLQGRVVAVMGATPGVTGTARAQTHLRQTLAYSEAWDVLDPQVLVGNAMEKFDADGRLCDEDSREAVVALLEGLRSLALLLRTAS